MEKISIVKSGNRYDGLINIKEPAEIGQETTFEFYRTFESDVPPATNKQEFIKCFFKDIIKNVITNKVIGFQVKQYRDDSSYIVFNTEIAMRGHDLDIVTFLTTICPIIQ